MFEVGKFLPSHVGNFYETMNGSKVEYRGLSWFMPLLLFYVVKGGHGVKGLSGDVAGSAFYCFENGSYYLRGDFRAVDKESVAARGMDIKGPWIEKKRSK